MYVSTLCNCKLNVQPNNMIDQYSYILLKYDIMNVYYCVLYKCFFLVYNIIIYHKILVCILFLMLSVKIRLETWNKYSILYFFIWQNQVGINPWEEGPLIRVLGSQVTGFMGRAGEILELYLEYWLRCLW